MSARQPASKPNRRRPRSRGGQAKLRYWLRGRRLVIGVASLAGLAVIAVLLLSRQQESLDLPSGLQWASITQAVGHVSDDVFESVGTGGLPSPIQTMSGSRPLGGVDGKPQVLYMGAEYCSTCASQRWSLIVALSRFGEFGDLQPMRSVKGDAYPEFPTFTFNRGQYTSPYVSLVALETSNRARQPLQRLSESQQSLMTQYNRAGTIPFISFGNRYYVVGSGFDMNTLKDKTWDDIAAVLPDSTSPITKSIVGNANYLAAAICKLTENQPIAVCQSSAVSAISSKLSG